MNRVDPISLEGDRPVSRRTLLLTAILLCLFYALLWSPWWYPLSDSALYLNMARALARGASVESLRQMHRDVRPFTPLLLAGIMKLGGGIGAMHAAMISLTLLSHALAFLTLRRWFDERMALMATVATATSWWVYANAFTIMTEPLFLVMFWAAMLAMSYLVPPVPSPAEGCAPRIPPVRAPAALKQWVLVIAAALLMAGAWENRVAAALLLPGMIFGLWMSNRDISRRTRIGWVAIFVVVFALLVWDYKRPAPGTQIPQAHEETYHLNFFVGMKNPVIQLPVSAGRWIIEGLAATGAVPFDMASQPIRVAAGAAAILILILACIGWWRLWRGRHWYAVGMAAYFVPILVQWGARIKPRYMTPIAPVLFIQLWLGAAWCLRSLSPGTPGERARVRGSSGISNLRSQIAAPLTLTLSPRSTAGRGDRIGTVLLAILLAMNLVPYGIEVYLRHGSSRNFYDLARRGGFAELIDIGGYIKHHAAKDAVIWVNWPPPSSRPPDAVFAPDRRIVQFLSDRDVRFMKADGSGDAEPGSSEQLDRFFSEVEGDWAIVYYSRLGWPSYHLPLAGTVAPGSGPCWWQLYHRSAATHRFEPVDMPRQRDYVRSIPGLH